MSKDATREYIVHMRTRYCAMRTKRAKGRLLDEFCAVTEFERKHAIKTLRGSETPLRNAGRRPAYTEAGSALREIWLLFDQPCSKLLHPMMADYVRSYETHKSQLTDSVRKMLLSMSASTIDRLLRPHRVETSLWRGRGGPMNMMKREIDVRSERWRGRGPGWFEADSVAHCGGSMAGSFAYTLTFTDTDTQWTELRSVWNRGAHATTTRVEEIEASLPFEIRGVNTDNGSEFLNWHLINYLRDRNPPVIQTRSRPYHKNDNAHVEQKNSSHVRALLGYDRFDDARCVEPLNDILQLHSSWTNLYRPCMKLIEKIKVGPRYRKKYDTPQTPAQRLLSSDSVEDEVKSSVKSMIDANDCYKLKLTVQRKLDRFLSDFAP